MSTYRKLSDVFSFFSPEEQDAIVWLHEERARKIQQRVQDIHTNTLADLESSKTAQEITDFLLNPREKDKDYRKPTDYRGAFNLLDEEEKKCVQDTTLTIASRNHAVIEQILWIMQNASLATNYDSVFEYVTGTSSKTGTSKDNQAPTTIALINLTDTLLFLRSIDELGLPVRAINCLQAESIHLIWDLCQKTERELMGIPNLWEKTLCDINEALGRQNLSLWMPQIPNWEQTRKESLQ